MEHSRLKSTARRSDSRVFSVIPIEYQGVLDIIFYQYSILLSIAVTLLAGAFEVMAPATYRRIQTQD